MSHQKKWIIIVISYVPLGKISWMFTFKHRDRSTLSLVSTWIDGFRLDNCRRSCVAVFGKLLIACCPLPIQLWWIPGRTNNAKLSLHKLTSNSKCSSEQMKLLFHCVYCTFAFFEVFLQIATLYKRESISGCKLCLLINCLAYRDIRQQGILVPPKTYKVKKNPTY